MITDIKIRKIFPAESTIKAIVSITLDDFIAIHDIKIVQTNRTFVAMPSRKDENGTFRDIVHPISPEARQDVEGQILEAYKEYIAGIKIDKQGE